MRQFLRSGVLWQFAGGFVLGAFGLIAMEPPEATHALASHFRPAAAAETAR